MDKKIKIALAAVLGVAAVIVILVNLGVFDKPEKPPADPMANYTPEQKDEYKKEQEQRLIIEKKRPSSGA